MAGCVQEARQIAETARRKRQEELDAERGGARGTDPNGGLGVVEFGLLNAA